MFRSTFRRTAVAGAFALMAAAPLAACAGHALAPLPVEAADSPSATAPAPTPAPTPSTQPGTSTRPGNSPPRVTGSPTARKPVHTSTTAKSTRSTTKPPSACHGAVQVDLDLQNTELALIKTMCFRVGGVLRLHGIGPGLVAAQPTTVVSSSYEAGVVSLRFIRPGTATVTIPQDEQTYTITVVVIS
jgi:hypothetical protein